MSNIPRTNDDSVEPTTADKAKESKMEPLQMETLPYDQAKRAQIGKFLPLPDALPEFAIEAGGGTRKGKATSFFSEDKYFFPYTQSKRKSVVGYIGELRETDDRSNSFPKDASRIFGSKFDDQEFKKMQICAFKEAHKEIQLLITSHSTKNSEQEGEDVLESSSKQCPCGAETFTRNGLLKSKIWSISE